MPFLRPIGLRTASTMKASVTRDDATTRSKRHEPGTPFSSRSPRSSNAKPDPATRSRTVPETTTSPAPAAASTRAPTWTASPASFPSERSHSPVWMPARTSRPRPRVRSTTARAHAIARAGPSNDAKKPSPAVSSSVPRNRASSCRTSRRCSSRSSRQRWSPNSAARSVDPTRSVKRSVASTESGTGVRTVPSRNASIASSAKSFSKIALPIPGRTTCSASGIALATSSASSRTNSFDSTSVGTRIVGRTSPTSRSTCIRRNSAHVAGVAVRRWCQTNHSRYSGSSAHCGLMRPASSSRKPRSP